MAGFPRFRLYAADGVTLVYEFVNVTDIDDFADPTDSVEHTSLRGQGSIITEGSDAPWDLPLDFVLIGEDYEDLSAQIINVKNTIVKFTKYILKVDVTTGTTQDYKVMRLQTFEFPIQGNKKRINFQHVKVNFRVDSWG